MLLNLFTALREAKVPVSLREHLTLVEALGPDLAGKRVEDFYVLARTALVKDRGGHRTDSVADGDAARASGATGVRARDTRQPVSGDSLAAAVLLMRARRLHVDRGIVTSHGEGDDRGEAPRHPDMLD